ncbi:MAG: nucleoside triphosphate pyrophosphohydrolase [Candidatus Latescibacteria bacterium]|nr:nucleoside triphosphate pyrophosphohydrolase [Candidatus Latescibacterota bacterium]
MKTSFAELVDVMARLRAPDGCPWDREQTHETLKPYLLEEAYEVLEAIDEADDTELCAELGDVLLQVVFHAQVASEEGRFTVEDVGRAIVDKLIRRHPHVFGDVKVDGADQVVQNWEQIKKTERQEKDRPDSLLDGIPKQLPALLRAQRAQSKVSRQGFDWDKIDGPLDKVEEEFAEVRQAWKEGTSQQVEEEVGDLLFALVNSARFLDVNPEDALRRSVAKFERRFRAIEAELEKRGKSVEEASIEEMDAIWDAVKAEE